MSERSTSVQSVERAFAILEAMAQENQEMGVTQLAEKLSLPAPTIHRSMKTLVALGYARQNATRRYSLGSRLLYLGDSATRGMAAWAKPTLLALSNECGETVNLATLEGELIVYTAQSPSRHSMRMFTEVGRRVLPHSCGVGKAIMSQLSDAEAQKITKSTGMPRFTSTTITTWKELKADLEKIRMKGYAIDEGEQEIGVRCIAVSVPGMSTPTALSISGPQTRVDNEFIKKYKPSILRAAEALSVEFSRVATLENE
jgi:IclR family acetate operon transcriptional repressor